MKNVSNHVLLNQLKSVSPRLRGFGFEHFEHTTGQHLGTPRADSCKKIPRYASRPTSWSQCEISQPKSRLRGGKPGDMQRMQWTTGSPEWPGYDLWRCSRILLPLQCTLHGQPERDPRTAYIWAFGRDKNLQNPPEKRPCASEETEQYSRAHCRTAAKAQSRSIKYLYLYGDSQEWWDDHHPNAMFWHVLTIAHLSSTFSKTRFEDDPAVCWCHFEVFFKAALHPLHSPHPWGVERICGKGYVSCSCFRWTLVLFCVCPPQKQLDEQQWLTHIWACSPFKKIQMCRYLNIFLSGWWFGKWILFFHILGMSSSQLTKSIIFQRARAQPSTSY